MDLGAMAMKSYSTFPQSSSITIRLFSVISKTLVGGGSYLSAKMQSEYSAAPVDWAMSHNIYIYIYHTLNILLRDWGGITLINILPVKQSKMPECLIVVKVA